MAMNVQMQETKAPTATETKWNRLTVSAMGLMVAVMTSPAFAGSSDMPWESPMQKILNSVTGPVAKIIGVCIIVGFGLGLAASEAGGAIRKGLGIVFGISIAFAAAQWGLTFFGFAGGGAF